MTGVGAAQGLTYLAVFVFLVVLVRRTARYASAPMHLRWELYPVPHEVGKEYGGSYLEELDWWLKSREKTLVGELKVMIPEMTLLVTLWHHNRKMWRASFPFHIGIYISIIFVLLLIIDGIAQSLGASVAAGSDVVLSALYYLTIVAGVVGMLAVTLGSLGLLALRLDDEGLRRYSAPADYFNLIFILAIALLGLFSWLTVDPSFSVLRGYFQGLVTINPPASLGGPVLAEVVLLSLFLIYMPFTHMTHFVGKYVTYHTVRWDDEPNLRGGDYEKQLAGHLNRPVNWSAPHIGKGKSWAEVATKRAEE